MDRVGYCVITAKDGEEAITKFKQHRDNISLIISDMVMPKKNGWEMYDEISRIKPEVKVLFVSGYSTEMIESKGISVDSADFVSKPFLKNDLLKKTREILDRNQDRK